MLVCVFEGEGVLEGVTLGEGEDEDVTLGEGVLDGVTLGEGEFDGVGVLEGVTSAYTCTACRQALLLEFSHVSVM